MKYLLTIILSVYSIILVAQNNENTKIILNNKEVIEGEVILQNEQVIIIKTVDGSKYQFPVTDVETIIQKSNTIEHTENSTLPLEKKITLRNGDIFIGNILVENEQVVMFQTKEGNRFQFPQNEVKSIQNIQEGDISEQNDTEYSKFTMMPDIRTGFSYSKESYQWAQEMQISLTLGGINFFIPNSFLGIGAGYRGIFTFDYNNNEIINFLPLFIQFRSTFTDKKLTPYIEMRGGYSFALTDNFGGGVLFEASAGISLKINNHNSFQAGIYAGLHSFSGNLTEEKEFGIFEYYGKTTSKQAGIKISVNF